VSTLFQSSTIRNCARVLLFVNRTNKDLSRNESDGQGHGLSWQILTWTQGRNITPAVQAAVNSRPQACWL